MKPLIGLGHRKRSGKDEVAAALMRDGFALVRVAQPLYDLAGLLVPALERGEDLYRSGLYCNLQCAIPAGTEPTLLPRLLEAVADRRDELLVQEDGKSRALLIWLGEFLRAAKPSIIRDWLELRIGEALDLDVKGVVVPDIRLLAEADVILRNNGLLVRVARHGAKAIMEGMDAHQTETELDHFAGYHVTLNNDGDLEQLYGAARWVWKNAEELRARALSDGFPCGVSAVGLMPKTEALKGLEITA